MPRPRTLDPLGMSDHPVVVTDPDRERALVDEFRRRLAYVDASFRLARVAIPGDKTFNRSLNRLKQAVKRRRPALALRRLHPEIALVIAHLARCHATEREADAGATVLPDDIAYAAKEVALTLPFRRGAPNDRMLRHHAWGLMALFQQTSGKPVLVSRYTKDIYSPKPTNALAEQVVAFFGALDPSIRAARIVRLIPEGRRTYAGRAMDFGDFFPLYGASISGETGTFTGRGGDIIVIDDPIKPEEANSDTTRDFVNHWFQSTLASRLNDKATGAIITVMQRLHQYDLAGMLIETGGWDQLSLPAIAIEDETIHLGRDRVHHRKAGEILHPARESRGVLDQLKAAMGSTAFAAQYQQQPFPMSGNMVKAAWLRTYPTPFDQSASGRIVQSWDTATKGGPENDWSVCITANISRSEVRILDVFRRRLEFPELKRAAIRLAQEHRVQVLLIEDQGSGQQLIQTLRDEQPRGVPLPIGRRPEGDKIARMAGATGQIEGGQLLLPADAPWLADFKSEVLAFPSVRHDDQVDALSQMMNWLLRSRMDLQPLGAAPIIMYADDYATARWNDGADDQLFGSPYSLGFDPW